MSANPFDELLGLVPARLPKSGNAVLVLDGKPITDARQLQGREDIDLDAARRDLERARNRARYQRQRQNPAAMAKRAEWAEKNRDSVRAYKRKWDEENIDRSRELKRESARRAYRDDPEKARASSRRYYERNREKILARLKAERDAKKAPKAGGAA